MPFKPGDLVRPGPGYSTDAMPLPSGKVKRVSPFGRGQVLLIEGTRAWVLSGYYEIDDSRADEAGTDAT